MAVKALVQHAPLAAFDRLGIQHGHARARLPERGSPLPLAAHQGLIERRPAPVDLPATEILVDQRESRKLVQQQPPLKAALCQIEQRIDNQAQ